MKPRRHLLNLPQAYRAFSRLVGGRARQTYVREHVCPQAGMRILDIGCGVADIVAFLPRDIDYTGFDESPAYIAAARERFGDRGDFVCQRVTSELISCYTDFDLVLANGVLHHLDDADAEVLLRIARAALRPDGRLLTLDGCFTREQSRLANYLLKRDRGRFVRDEPHYTTLARAVFSRVEARVRNDLMRIPYTHIIMDCRT